MKFCCFAFEMYYTLENQYCYNIRKVKLTSPRLTEYGMMKYYNIPSLRGTRHKRADICFVMTMVFLLFTRLVKIFMTMGHDTLGLAN